MATVSERVRLRTKLAPVASIPDAASDTGVLSIRINFSHDSFDVVEVDLADVAFGLKCDKDVQQI